MSAPSKRCDIAVLGEAMIEIAGIADGMCRLGVAGDTYNTAVYLARAGMTVSYASCVGLDHFSDLILQGLQREGIGAELVLRTDGAPGLYAISLDANGERSFTYWRANSVARRFFDVAGVQNVLDRVAKADLLYFSGITLSLFSMAEITQLRDLALAMRRAGKSVVFDTNYRSSGWSAPALARQAIECVAPCVSLALPTFEDEALLFGDTSAEATALRWRGLGADEVVVKQGQTGAYIPGAGWIVPPVILSPRDTTGAGDSFNGAYIAARIAGANQEEAAIAGHELAARVIMVPGAILPA